MKTLNRYIGASVLRATGIVLLVVIGVDLFVNLAAEFNDIGDGDYTAMRALLYVPMNMPLDIYTVFPIIGLIGSLLGLGVLMSTNELMVMRTSGVSVFQICGAVMRAAMILILLMTLIGEVVAPRLEFIGDRMKARAQFGDKAIATLHGLWMRDGRKFIHIDTVVNQKQLNDVTVYQFDDNLRLLYAEKAQEMHLVQGKWIAFDIARTLFYPSGTKTEHMAKQTWPLRLDSNLLNLELTEPGDMTLSQLYRYIKYRQRNGLQVNSYWLAWWQRLFQPLATLVMILLAIPFVFGAQRSKTLGGRILVGLMLGLAFYILDRVMGQMSVVYRISPAIGALMPIILFAIFGLAVMRRVR